MGSTWEIYCRVDETAGIIGAGLLFVRDDKIVRRSKFRFHTMKKLTHNMAELLALQCALQPLRKRCAGDDVVVWTSSNYAAYAVSGLSKGKANRALVTELRKIADEFEDLEFRVGLPSTENQKTSQLAWQAVRFMKDVTVKDVSDY